MKYLSKGFWEFDHDCKWDVLQEPQHTHIIHNALRDEETSIEYNNDGSYTLFGKHEALLVFPRLLCTQLLIQLYILVKTVLS